jgi:hypothetical protein
VPVDFPSLIPVWRLTTILQTAPTRREVIVHRAKTCGNDDDRSFRTKLAGPGPSGYLSPCGRLMVRAAPADGPARRFILLIPPAASHNLRVLARVPDPGHD